MISFRSRGSQSRTGHRARLNMPDPPNEKTRAQVRKAISKSRLKFDMSWDQLREMTREP